MDITYYSALGADERRLAMARAIQLFMPGKPQVWYLDLLAGENDLEVFERDPEADNREINRTAFTKEETAERLSRPVVREQIGLLRLRNGHPAFCEDAKISAKQPEEHRLSLTWRHGEDWATLEADLKTMRYTVDHS